MLVTGLLQLEGKRYSKDDLNMCFSFRLIYNNALNSSDDQPKNLKIVCLWTTSSFNICGFSI